MSKNSKMPKKFRHLPQKTREDFDEEENKIRNRLHRHSKQEHVQDDETTILIMKKLNNF